MLHILRVLHKQPKIGFFFETIWCQSIWFPADDATRNFCYEDFFKSILKVNFICELCLSFFSLLASTHEVTSQSQQLYYRFEGSNQLISIPGEFHISPVYVSELFLCFILNIFPFSNELYISFPPSFEEKICLTLVYHTITKYN